MNNGLLDRLDRLFLVVTANCNARCLLCQYWKSKSKGFLSLSLLKKKIVPLINKYHVGLTLITGGEPTLHPQLPAIVKTLEKTGTRITLITNGTHLDVVFDEIKDRTDAYMFSLDAARGKLLQRQGFFENCVHYFQALSRQQEVEFNDPDEVCQVPFTSIVIDESACLSPCFYLPYSVSVGQDEDPVNGDYPRNIRKEISNNPGIRKKYCSFCLQFQG